MAWFYQNAPLAVCHFFFPLSLLVWFLVLSASTPERHAHWAEAEQYLRASSQLLFAIQKQPSTAEYHSFGTKNLHKGKTRLDGHKIASLLRSGSGSGVSFVSIGKQQQQANATSTSDQYTPASGREQQAGEKRSSSTG